MAGERMSLAPYLDHTLLAPDATPDAIERLCDEAREHGFAAVCVNGWHVRRAARRLAGSRVAVASTVGFPLGAQVPEVKAFEARRALEDGARELDVVLSIGALKAGDDALVTRDLEGVCAAAGSDALVKVILETALLSDDEKVRACRLAVAAGAGFVKTSTGFGGGGATVGDVALLRATVGQRAGVKAAGGIRTAADARRMLAAGASRIGSSAAVAIVRECG